MLNREDIRITKTFRALMNSMFTLLSRRNFNAITVNDLCAEALISRATFYTHFRDKYDLLKYFSDEIRKDIIKDVTRYNELEIEVNQFVSLHKKIIRNIINEANSETLQIVREFMAAIVGMTIKRQSVNNQSPDHIILFNFFVGGLVNHLSWLVENDFPPEVKMINSYLYDMLESLTIWDSEQEKLEGSDLN